MVLGGSGRMLMVRMKARQGGSEKVVVRTKKQKSKGLFSSTYFQTE